MSFPADRRSRRQLLAVLVGALLAGGCGASSGSPPASSAAATAQTASTPAQPDAVPRSGRPGSAANPHPPASTETLRTRELPGELAGKVVLVDPGHNGGNFAAPEIINRLVPAGRGRMKPCNTTGTETDSGYTEAAFNWDVALRLRRLLVGEGAHVVFTRHSNTGVGPCVDERAAIGNRAHVDAAIAIHADGGPGDGRGFQVIYAPDEGSTAPTFTTSLRLARSVHRALLSSGVFPPSTYDGVNGYSVRNDLAGLNLSTRPAIFVELGNMRNPVDAALQTKPAVRQRLAEALDQGLRSFLLGEA